MNQSFHIAFITSVSDFFQTLFASIMKSPKQGSDSIVFSAVSKSIEGQGGIYVDNSRVVEPSTFAQDRENQRKLWDISCELTGI